MSQKKIINKAYYLEAKSLWGPWFTFPYASQCPTVDVLHDTTNSVNNAPITVKVKIFFMLLFVINFFNIDKFRIIINNYLKKKGL